MLQTSTPSRLLPLTTSALAASLTLFGSAALAQTSGTIKGKVLAADRQAAVGVSVGVLGTTQGTITDAEGSYYLKLPEGTYTLVLTAIGLEKKEQAVSVLPNRTTTVPTVVLKETSMTLENVQIVGEKQNKFSRKQSGEFVSRLPISNLENAQTYSVVTKELLQDQVVTNTADALLTAPGVSGITRSGGSGGTGQTIRLRGFTSTTNLRNGLQTAQLNLSDPQLTERIEIVKGPNGTLYGTTSGPGGLVNRVTKRPYRQFGGEISYTGGSWDQQRATLDLNTPLLQDSTLLVRLNAVAARERSFQDAGATRSFLLAPSVTYQATARLSFDLDMELYNTRFNNTTYSLNNALFAAPTSNNPAGGFLYKRKFSELARYINYERSYTNNDFQTTQNVYNVFARANYQVTSWLQSQTLYSLGNADYLNRSLTLTLLPSTTRLPGDAGFDPAATRLQRTVGYIPSNFSNVQVQQNFIGDYKIGPLRNRTVLGFDHSRWFTLDNRVSGTNTIDGTTTFPLNQPNVVPAGSTDIGYDASTFNLQAVDNLLATRARSRINRRFYTTSAYVADVLNLTDNLLLSGGVRIDRIKVGSKGTFREYEQTAVSPKAGLVYQVLKDRLSVYGNYQNGFTNNQPQDNTQTGEAVYYSPTQTIQWEGGAKLELLEGRLTGNASYYAIRQNDILRADPASTTATPLPSLQDDARTSRGVDLELIANPVVGLNFIAGYSYNKSRYLLTNEGNTPEQAPRHVANLWVSYRLSNLGVEALDGLGFGFGGNYSSDVYANADNTLIIDGYKLLSASVFYDARRFRLSVKANNLTDEHYWIGTTSLTPQNPRQILGSLALRF